MIPQDVRAAALCIAVGFALVVLALCTQGCGKIHSDTEVHGQVNHVVTLNLDNLKTYFAYECHEKNPGDKCYEPVEADCVTCMTADFLQKVPL